MFGRRDGTPDRESPTADRQGGRSGSRDRKIADRRRPESRPVLSRSQANALNVEWSFGDGTPVATEDAYQYESSRTEHAFTATGTHAVKETIHRDWWPSRRCQGSEHDRRPCVPTAQFSGPSEVAPGSANVRRKGSSDPNGKAIVKYVWKFGDGTAKPRRRLRLSPTPTRPKAAYGEPQGHRRTKLTSPAATHAIPCA